MTDEDETDDDSWGSFIYGDESFLRNDIRPTHMHNQSLEDDVCGGNKMDFVCSASRENIHTKSSLSAHASSKNFFFFYTRMLLPPMRTLPLGHP